MELHTPDPETITVTDYDFQFGIHGQLTLTLRPEDTLTYDEASQAYAVTLAATGEHYDIPRAAVVYLRQHARLLTKASLEPVAAPVRPGAPPRPIHNLQVTPERPPGSDAR